MVIGIGYYGDGYDDKELEIEIIYHKTIHVLILLFN